MLNVFFGPFSCLFGNESIQCGNIRNGLLMAFCALYIFVLVTLTLIFRLFMHPFDIRNAGLFSCQSGQFYFLNQISTFIQIALICLFHNSTPNSIIKYSLLNPMLVSYLKIVVVIIGELMVIVLLIYIIWQQPFFRWEGNAIYAAYQGAKSFLFFEAAVLEFIQSSKISKAIETELVQQTDYPGNSLSINPISHIMHLSIFRNLDESEDKLNFILIWSSLFVGVFIIGIICFFLTRLRSMTKWVIKRGQIQLPLLPGKCVRSKKPIYGKIRKQNQGQQHKRNIKQNRDADNALQQPLNEVQRLRRDQSNSIFSYNEFIPISNIKGIPSISGQGVTSATNISKTKNEQNLQDKIFSP
ncbi:MAG: hypothetical protein EZS28_014469 [Streblomastix strix]|uniref:Transmembrane protein n=1 Tax=Streblomastix strix TaxID=222440 RepID=A0A5J4W672_9EUKA|nr:MAG: hypothetical protein EZS28_014469 [Streblomastix strix]